MLQSCCLSFQIKFLRLQALNVSSLIAACLGIQAPTSSHDHLQTANLRFKINSLAIYHTCKHHANKFILIWWWMCKGTGPRNFMVRFQENFIWVPTNQHAQKIPFYTTQDVCLNIILLKCYVHEHTRDLVTVYQVRMINQIMYFIYKLALYLPYVQGLFTMINNGNFTICTCSSIQ